MDRGHHGHMVVGFTTVHITTKVVSSNPIHGNVYSIQHFVIVCQSLATGQWFSPGTPVSSTNKTDRHNITYGVKHHKPIMMDK